MADSEQDKQADSSFDDDLDKMLQDTVDQVDNDQDVLDSDDAIDRLLGDSQSDEALDDEFSESVDDLVDSLLDGVSAEQGQTADLSNKEIDEFADDPGENEATDTKVEASTAPEPSSVLTDDEMSAFADDLLAEQEGIEVAMQEKPKVDVDSTESMTEIDEFSVDDEEDDFLLADFDISADDDELKEKAVELSTPDQTEQAAAVANPEVVPERVDAAVIPSSSNSVMTNDQSERIAQIESELAELKLGLNFSEALDKVVKNQKKANRELDEANKKLKVWSISALVVGVIALIVGITVVVLNSGVQSSVERIQESVMDIEDRLAVPVIKLADPNDAKIADLQLSVQSMQALINNIPERLNALQGQVNSINTEEIQTLVDQRLVDIDEKLAALEAKMVSSKRVKVKRKAVKHAVAQEWVVNFISFKQRWYTDKKVQEYKQKGIPAEVVPVDVQGVRWFRVRVAGFKDKTEAAAYAIKMKKSLNLNSVWVSKK